MYCLDTNVIINILRGDESLREFVEEKEDICVTTITLCELFKGAYLSSKKEKELSMVKLFLNNVEIIGLDINSCELFGRLFLELQNKGKMTSEPDLMIASIAKAHNTTLITQDKKHFDNVDLDVEEL